MNIGDYYNNMDFKYPEIATCMEKGKYKIKLYIPSIMALVANAGANPKSVNNKQKSKSILQNKESVAVSTTISHNYITLNVSHITTDTIEKGEQFIVVFIGGNVNKPYVLGRYIE